MNGDIARLKANPHPPRPSPYPGLVPPRSVYHLGKHSHAEHLRRKSRDRMAKASRARNRR